jgi:hypothetical protein
MKKIYTGDTGTDIVLDCNIDVSSASARAIEVRKPDSSTVTWSAVAEGTTSIKYTSLAGTFDQAGDWELQASVTLPGGNWRGETVLLRVYARFD